MPLFQGTKQRSATQALAEFLLPDCAARVETVRLQGMRLKRVGQAPSAPVADDDSAAHAPLGMPAVHEMTPKAASPGSEYAEQEAVQIGLPISNSIDASGNDPAASLVTVSTRDVGVDAKDVRAGVESGDMTAEILESGPKEESKKGEAEDQS